MRVRKRRLTNALLSIGLIVHNEYPDTCCYSKTSNATRRPAVSRSCGCKRRLTSFSALPSCATRLRTTTSIDPTLLCNDVAWSRIYRYCIYILPFTVFYTSARRHNTHTRLISLSYLHLHTTQPFQHNSHSICTPLSCLIHLHEPLLNAFFSIVCFGLKESEESQRATLFRDFRQFGERTSSSSPRIAAFELTPSVHLPYTVMSTEAQVSPFSRHKARATDPSIPNVAATDEADPSLSP